MRANPAWLKKKDEPLWRRAKEIVAEQRGRRGSLKPGDWALVTHVFKGMGGQTSIARDNPDEDGWIEAEIVVGGTRYQGWIREM